MVFKKSIKITLLALAMTVLMTGCYGASHLKTSYLQDESSISGTFDVVYYTDELGNNPGSIVVLDVASDGYTIIPYAPDSSYLVESGLSASDAIEKAMTFLEQNMFYSWASYSTIHAPDGAVVGYQVTPQYEAMTYISRATMGVNYFMENGDTIRFIVHEAFPKERLGPFLHE